MKEHVFDEVIRRTDYGIGIIDGEQPIPTVSKAYTEIKSEDIALCEEPIMEKPKRKLRDEAHEKIESVLNLRTFFLVASATVLLGFYIYNVISINRVAGERERLRLQIEEVKSVNVELESELKMLQRSERIGREASEKLGLQISTHEPIELFPK